MIGSSEGRSYRHHKINGFGITDFHISPVGSPTRIIAYGPPPPVAMSNAPAPPTQAPQPIEPQTTDKS
jgi:hypothetical protein